jgi:putative phage-type endonuclease
VTQALSTHGIGASEVAAVCGMNPFSSVWDIWLRKTGQAPDEEPSGPLEWGLRLEPAIRQKYADETGATLYVPSASLFHAAHAWARATPDAIVLTRAGEPAAWSHLVQCKNVGYWPARDGWESGPPAYVVLQEQWELYVTGLARADVAALIGGSDYRVFTVHRDDSVIAMLMELAERFWIRHVIGRTPPKIDESDACARHFNRRLARVPSVELQADAETEAMISKWHRVRRAQKAVEKRIETLRNTVRARLDEAQADRIVARAGIPKLARTPAREHKETSTNWRLVAELLGTSDADRFRELVAANTATTTTTIEASVSLREPREWSKEGML